MSDTIPSPPPELEAIREWFVLEDERLDEREDDTIVERRAWFMEICQPSRPPPE